jgi:hypothetical protein
VQEGYLRIQMCVCVCVCLYEGVRGCVKLCVEVCVRPYVYMCGSARVVYLLLQWLVDVFVCMSVCGCMYMCVHM